MDSLWRHAAKLSNQVASKVQQQFLGGSSENMESITDEAGFYRHQKLEDLYTSTRTAKRFQRDIVRCIEGYIASSSKQVEIGKTLSENSYKYGKENPCTSGDTLARAALSFGKARSQMEKERLNLMKTIGIHVTEPLRTIVKGAPLEDARHLYQRYDKILHETEAQAIEVSRRQMRVKETPGNSDNILKLETAEAKLDELKSNMEILGKEAYASMTSVEAQQQRHTLERLVSMVLSEQTYHRNVLQILDQLRPEMVSEFESVNASFKIADNSTLPSYEEANETLSSQSVDVITNVMEYFLGEVIQSYQAESEVELNLSKGDFVVVRKVSKNGWAEGECKGKAGWFPCGFIEKRDNVLASKVY